MTLFYMLYGLTVANCWPSVFISIWVEPRCQRRKEKKWKMRGRFSSFLCLTLALLKSPFLLLLLLLYVPPHQFMTLEGLCRLVNKQ
jgi:hypothetical protein